MQERHIGPLGVGKSFFVLAGSLTSDALEEMMESRGFTETQFGRKTIDGDFGV